MSRLPWDDPTADVIGDIRRAVEEARVAGLEHAVREDIRADFLNDDGLSPWDRP